MDYYQIGQRVRKYRKAHKLSQEELAELVGISTTHMSHIETGNTKLSLPVCVALADALQIQTDDLLRSQPPVSTAARQALASILEGCSEEETRIIADVVSALKIALDKCKV